MIVLGQEQFYTNGQESITLKDNSRYEIVAATRDGSRGKHADLLFIDEAVAITEQELDLDINDLDILV